MFTFSSIAASCLFFVLCSFFFNDTATTEIYTYLHTLSLHDALPIWGADEAPGRPRRRRREFAGCDDLHRPDACGHRLADIERPAVGREADAVRAHHLGALAGDMRDRKSTRLNSSH